MSTQNSNGPLFPLGQIVMTRGAQAALEQADQTPFEFVTRHVHGDWGDLDDEDKQANDNALKRGGRLLSAYHTSQNVKIWLITEADYSASTILLPSEY